MVLVMARPFRHPATGIYWFRKRVPDALRSIVGKREHKVSLRTRDPAEARVAHARVSAEVEEQWSRLKAGIQVLSHRQAEAVAGEIYRSMIADHDAPFVDAPAYSWPVLSACAGAGAARAGEATNGTPGARRYPCLQRLTASSDSTINQRMRYAGGKGRLWQEIVSLMPPHDTYIETHLGGGAVMRNKRPARINIGVDIDPQAIRNASTWDVPTLSLFNSDACAFLADYPFVGGELVYADPPYMAATKKNRRYYRYEYTDDDHHQLLGVLSKLNCQVMISGYASPLYEQALRGWEVKELINISHAGPRRERIWANFKFSSSLHDYAPIGGNFRERERIRRKTNRWVRKLAQLPDLERQAVLTALIQSANFEPISSNAGCRGAELEHD